MTSSFNTVLGSQRDAPPDISKWNYASTEVDLVKSVNSEIDETTKKMNDHFNLVIAQENQYNQNKQARHKELLELIPNAVQSYVDIRDRREANALFNDFSPLSGNQVDDQVKSKLKEKHEKEDKSLTESLTEENKISGEIQAHQDNFLKEGQTDAGLLAQDAVVKASRSRNDIKALHDAAQSGWPKFKVIAEENYLHEMPDGRWITLKEAASEPDEYYEIAYRGTVELFLAQTIAGNKFSKRLLNKYLVRPIFQDFQKDKKGYVKAQVDAQKALMERDRYEAMTSLFAVGETPSEVVDGEALTQPEIEEKNAKELGNKITDYLGNFHAFHAYSWSNGRTEMFGFMEQAWNSGELSDQDIIRIGEAVIKGHDGKSRKLKDYWNKEYGPLRKKVRIKQGEQIAQHEQDIDTQQHNWWQETKGSEEWTKVMDDSKSTVEQKLEYLKKLEQQAWDKGWDKPVQELKRNITRFDDLGPDVEEEHFNFLWARHEAGYKIDPSELREFDPTGPYYSKIKAIVDGPNMDASQVKSAESFIGGLANDEVKRRTATTVKNSTHRAITDQANKAFAEHFRAQKSLGKTDEEAMSFARTEIKKEIEAGLYNQYPAYNPNHTAAQDLLNVKDKIKSDPTHLSSKEPWVGEEVHLQAALKYYQLGEGVIRTGPDPTEYYKNFSTLGNKTWSVSDVMKHRLVSTGLIKDDGTVDPVKALALKEQILLKHKPSAGRTYRALFEDVEGKEPVLDYTNFFNFDQLSSATRANAQISNSYTTPGLDWIQLVNIEPELIDAYSDIVGETPFFMHLDNLLPGVAEEQVKRTLIEPKEPFDMATLGQAETAGESFQKTGIAQTIVGTRELVMNALTDEAGNLNATGRVIARVITGEGARDIEAWIETAPIGKIISILDGILDGPTMEEISKSNE
tara:strand:- start:6771 stop:9506 length:2736 start_codon:yes stop_codon:yes gene_type:complete